MSEGKLLTVREAALSLGVTEKEVIDLADKGLLRLSKIGSGYVRFNRDDVERVKKLGEFSEHGHRFSFRDNLYDFFYFNDFYLVAFLIIAGLLYIIMSR
ncbi:MAG: helix-turn-helix domain-containing protein [Candidatus Omnitrophica bacterium]|nr:helix-turn-helix domain-containing protein [Candidatus Omnitrophota bacterium]